MTWTKFGSEFFDDCANHGLSDAALRTHSEAIGWLYNVESQDLTINKHLVRRFAGSENYESGITDLLAVGFWRTNGDKYQVVHHADVIRQSLAAQHKKRERDKKASRDYRKRHGLSVSDDVSADVGNDVSDDADRQTDKQLERDTRASAKQLPENNQDRPAERETPPTSSSSAALACPHGMVNGDQPDPWVNGRFACPQCALALVKDAS